MKKECILDKGIPAFGPYSHAVECKDFIFISGQIGVDPRTGVLVEGGAKAQADMALTNAKSILASVGLDLGDVVKTTIFLTDINDFSAVNDVYATYFPKDYPARSTVQIAALAKKGGSVEIEMIACR